VLLTTQGISSPVGTRRIQDLSTREDVLSLSQFGNLSPTKIESMVLSKPTFSPIGLECSKGGSTVCHPNMLLLSSVSFASMAHSLFLVDCHGRGYGLAQFEKLPIALEEVPFHLLHHPSPAWKWQKLWFLKTFPTEQSRIFHTMKLSLMGKIPVLSSKEIESGLINNEHLGDLLSIQDASTVKRLLQKELGCSFEEPDLLTIAVDPGHQNVALAVIIGNLQAPEGTPDYDLQVVSSGPSLATGDSWRKIGSHYLLHKHGFANLHDVLRFLEEEFYSVELLCLLRFRYLSRLYRLQKAVNILPGSRIMGIENSRLVDRVLVKKVELEEEQRTCVEFSLGSPGWLLADRFAVASSEWTKYVDLPIISS